MATIRKKNGKYQVQVRRKGHPTLSRTFVRRADASAWARETEVQFDRGGLPAHSMSLTRLSVADGVLGQANRRRLILPSTLNRYGIRFHKGAYRRSRPCSRGVRASRCL